MSIDASVEDINQLIELCSLRSEPIEWNHKLSEKLLTLGVKNGVGAWCYSQCKSGNIKGVADATLTPWKSIYFQNTIQYQRYFAVFNKVNKLLNESGIPVIALKGMALASSLYSDDGLRPMGDIDILVPEGMGMAALDILLKSGAQKVVVPRSKIHELSDAHVRAVRVDGIMVEIHQRLFALGSTYHTPDIDFFKHTTTLEKQGASLLQFNEVMMGYHLIAHAIKGIHMGGLRLGWLLDIALLLRSAKDIDAFTEAIIRIQPKKEKEILKLIDMALLFIPAEVLRGASSKQELLEEITLLVNNHDYAAKHRFINIRQLMNTPGVLNKLKLVLYEFFPAKEYMQFRYQTNANEPMWRLYMKRIVRR